MKRIMISLILALGIHGLLLGMEFDGLNKASRESPKSQVISITLVYLPPRVHEEKPVINKPVPPEDRPVTQTPMKIIPPKQKEKTKTSIEKSVKPPVQPEKKDMPKTEPAPEPEKSQSPERSLDQKPVTHTDGMKKEILSSFENELEIPTIQRIREARPMYLKNSPPRYPGTARKRGYQGTVVLEVLVDRDGNVGDLRLFISSGHKILDKAAMASVKEWLFEPGMRGDETIDMWVRVPIRFELK